jgi:hypothetical protein
MVAFLMGKSFLVGIHIKHIPLSPGLCAVVKNRYFTLGVFLARRVKFMSCDVQECGADLRVHQPPARPGVCS